MKNFTTVVALAACGLATLLLSCLPDGRVKVNFETVPAQLGDGWDIATPSEVGLDSAKVMAAFEMMWDEERFYNAKSLIVVRHGKLVAENYCRDTADRDVKAHVQSVSKSFTSLALGIIRDSGYVPNLDTTLYSIMPDKFDDDTVKRRITLRHLLTMKSGLEFDNDNYSTEMNKVEREDPARYILAKPRYASPGERFYYRDCDPQLIAYAVNRLTGRQVEEIVRQGIFEPLGITDYLWESNSDGVTRGGHSLFLRPRDMAKVGRLMLDGGAWQGRQLVSGDWVTLSTSAQTESLPGEDPAPVHYGFYWWSLPARNAFTAWGHGGQFIFVLPDYDMVVVMTSMPSSNDDYVGTRLPEFMDIVEQVVAAAKE